MDQALSHRLGPVDATALHPQVDDAADAAFDGPRGDRQLLSTHPNVADPLRVLGEVVVRSEQLLKAINVSEPEKAAGLGFARLDLRGSPPEGLSRLLHSLTGVEEVQNLGDAIRRDPDLLNEFGDAVPDPRAPISEYDPLRRLGQSQQTAQIAFQPRQSSKQQFRPNVSP